MAKTPDNSPESIDPDLQQIITFLSTVTKKLIERLRDGFQALPDIMALIPALLGGQEAYEGNENAWRYLASLDEEKTDETVNSILAELNEVSETKRAIIKYSLRALANGYMAYLAVKADGGIKPAGGEATSSPPVQ